MSNRIFLFSLIVVGALSACDKGAPEVGGATVADEQPTIQAASGKGVNEAVESNALGLPWGISPGVEFTLRSKASENGIDRLVVAYEAVDAKELDAKIENALKSKGFNRYGNFARDAELVGDYGLIKDGKPSARVTVTITPAADKPASGTVYFKTQ